MSREHAATIYLDVLLGCRGGYFTYLEAVEALSLGDRLAIERAVSGCSRSGDGNPRQQSFPLSAY